MLGFFQPVIRLVFQGVKQSWLSQWLTFKLLGVTYVVGKIKFKLLFNGPLAKSESTCTTCKLFNKIGAGVLQWDRKAWSEVPMAWRPGILGKFPRRTVGWQTYTFEESKGKFFFMSGWLTSHNSGWKTTFLLKSSLFSGHSLIFGWYIDGWFQLFFIVIPTPIPGEMIQFDKHIFQMARFNHQLEVNHLNSSNLHLHLHLS